MAGALALALAAASCRAEPAGRRAAAASGAPAASGGPALLAPFPTRFPAARRLVAVGDLHGDMWAARAALRLGGLIDERDQWIGADAVLVQTGDVLDRGDEERAILDLFDRLDEQAQRAGGRVHVLSGNHEIMNVAGDLRYVTPGGFAAFADAGPVDPADPLLDRYPEQVRPRLAAFRPGGPYARRLAAHPIVLVVGETLFVHGGLLPKHVRAGLEAINQEMRDWLSTEGAAGPELLLARDSPIWERRYAQDPSPADCQLAAETLRLAGARRLVVGHTTLPHGIASFCEDRVWDLDVGLARSYAGRIEVLEMSGAELRVLRLDAGAVPPAEPPDAGP
ncbi:MAG: metallophosphoesterase [Deltaproteobacteria bacterium]|nr:metallophosphoesterase [Deltaproteobacteria bacterium]